jgi:putative membrane-bound dehydrogenase-like protein
MNVLLALVAALAAQDKESPPFSPEESARRARLDPGLRLELVAAEPAVESPVAMAFDEHARLYVVEMLDYPVPEKDKPPQGRIKLLEDRDRDGRYETATVFADGLLMANGVLPWKGGVLVTCAPHILYLKDTDGDGRADRREPLYEGFAVQNPQLRVSFPTLGLDNWIYVANGQRGGKIRPADRPDAAAVDIGGMDFRFDLVRATHEPAAGMGQFGLAFDDWGRRFVCTNRNHLIPIVMENRYFARNPHMPPPAPRTDNQGAGGASRVYPIRPQKTLSAAHAGTFTAACGVWIYGGDLLPEPYRGAAFTCEPTGNLVHREIVSAQGAGFESRPAREGSEFLASLDPWFRPVSLAEGPDGALYVVDMYRAEVEHPEWVPKDLQSRFQWDHPRTYGRIWRIVPEGAARPAAAPRAPGTLSTAEQVELLESPNAWTRRTAHRLLLERQDRDAWGPLRKKALSPDPRARVHAAWLLEGHRSLDVDLVLRFLEDPHPRVRENALRLAERFMSWSGAVRERVAARAEDPDARVRFQAALCLGFWEADGALGPLARIARAAPDDPWTRRAVASAAAGRAGALLERLMRGTEHGALLRELAALVGARRDAAETAGVLRASSGASAAARRAVLMGLAEGVGRRGDRLAAWAASWPDAEARRRVEDAFAWAAESAADARRPAGERAEAARLLAHAPWASARPVLAALLEGDPSVEVRVAAAAALGAHAEPDVAEILMKSWKGYLPAVRREVLEALARRPERVGRLLEEIEAGRVSPAELGPGLTGRLRDHRDAAIRERARKLLASRGEDRAPVIERYKAALARRGDAARGREVFRKNCASCHRVAGIGTNVGPDISDTLSKSREQLLTDILDPSRVIDNNYVTYLVRTRGGQVFSGFIAQQTSTSLTLRRGENQEDTVLREDIEEIRSSDLSVMPGNLEQGISVEEMSDLLEFLKNWRDAESGDRR